MDVRTVVPAGRMSVNVYAGLSSNVAIQSEPEASATEAGGLKSPCQVSIRAGFKKNKAHTQTRFAAECGMAQSNPIPLHNKAP